MGSARAAADPAPGRVLDRRSILRWGLRCAAGGALAASPLTLSGCAIARAPLTVGAQVTQVPELLSAYNATNPPAKVKAVTAPQAVVQGTPPFPKQMPDIVDVNPDNLWVGGVGVAAGTTRAGPFLHPLDGLVAPAAQSALVAQSLESFRLQGNLYGMPYSFAHGGMVFNDSLAVPAGFSPPSAPLTLHQLQRILVAAAPKLPPSSAGIDYIEVAPPVWGVLAVGYGGTLTSAGRFTFADGAALPPIALLAAICRSYGGLGDFANGRALFSFAYGSAGSAGFAKANAGETIGLLPFPAMPMPRSPVLALAAGITTSCRDLPGAAAFLTWLSGITAQRQLDAHGAPSARRDLQSDYSWLPPLPPGDAVGADVPAAGYVIPQIFWHPAILAVLALAGQAAFSPGSASTPEQVFVTAQGDCNRALDALGLTAD